MISSGMLDGEPLLLLGVSCTWGVMHILAIRHDEGPCLCLGQSCIHPWALHAGQVCVYIG